MEILGLAGMEITPRIGKTFREYGHLYEQPFQDAFKSIVSIREQRLWSFRESDYLSCSDQAPLILRVISQYDPKLAIELVDRALCINAPDGRAYYNRDYAAMSIPFLHIKPEEREELIGLALHMIDRDQFMEYLDHPESETIFTQHDLNNYLSLSTLGCIVRPESTLLKGIRSQPLWDTLQDTDILNRVDLNSLNPIGLYKLKVMAWLKTTTAASKLVFDSTVSTESLNAERWFQYKQTRPGQATYIYGANSPE